MYRKPQRTHKRATTANKLSKVAGYKTNTPPPKLVVFYTSHEHYTKEMKDIISFEILLKQIKYAEN